MLNKLRPEPGTSIAVFGAGAAYLAAIMAARLGGATTIIAVDKAPNRLALARELGAADVVLADGNVVEAVKAVTSGGADHAVEATNSSDRVAEACRSLGLLGSCAMVGAPGSPRR